MGEAVFVDKPAVPKLLPQFIELLPDTGSGAQFPRVPPGEDPNGVEPNPPLYAPLLSEVVGGLNAEEGLGNC